jgi:hypothetical protein
VVQLGSLQHPEEPFLEAAGGTQRPDEPV